jgi:trans-feruloyl-CoA hydratase/vanillin synthase
MPDTFTGTNKCATVEIDADQIAWITLNRPEKRNAISPNLSSDMQECLDRVEHDDDVKVAVLTGAGDSYSAGMDLREFFRASDKLTPEKRAAFGRASSWQWRRLRYFLKPTICMVNGWCFGAGFNSMIACDLAVAADEAQFGLSEINWGMIPAGNVLKNVCSVMNQRDAMYYTITAETFDGKQAARMGVVNESVPRAQLKERVREVAKVLADKNPLTMRACKFAVKRVPEMSWDDADDYLMAKLDQMRFQDNDKGLTAGMKQFLDEKTYRPGLGNYDKNRA